MYKVYKTFIVCLFKIKPRGGDPNLYSSYFPVSKTLENYWNPVFILEFFVPISKIL